MSVDGTRNLIRQRVVRGLANEVCRMRVWLSSVDAAAADRLRAVEVDLVERMAAFAQEAIGYAEAQQGSRFAATRREVSKRIK